MAEVNLLHRYMSQARSVSADEREQAARELKMYLQERPACEMLTELLGDTDWRVRRAAVESFLEMRPQHSIPLILQALYEEENAGKRNAAIDILSRLGEEIVPYLEPHFHSDNTDVQMFLINMLGDLRDDTYLHYINRALSSVNLNIVSAAILALGKIGHTESLPQIFQFLHGADLWLKFQAIEAAGEMQDPATIPDLIQLYESQYCRKPVIKALSKFHHADAYSALVRYLIFEGKLDLDALEALIHLYYSPQPSDLQSEEQKRIRECCCATLHGLAIRILLSELSTASERTYKHILEILGWAQAEEAIPLLIGKLRDPELAETTAQSLIYCDRKSADPLLARLKEDPADEEVNLIMNILNELTSIVEIDEILSYLHHSSSDIRYSAYKLLGRSTSPDVIPLLTGGMVDGYAPVAETCRDLLLAHCRKSKTACRDVADTMRPKCSSPDAIERANSIEFLTFLEGEKAFSLLFQALKDEEALVRQKAVRLMGTGYHPDFQRPLIAALADEDARVRELAAQTLSRYSSTEVVDALLSSIHDEVLWVRIAACESLSAIGDPRIAAPLRQQTVAENPIARAMLLRALGRLRDRSSKEFILMYLRSEDAEIRKSACESLAAWNDPDSVFHLFHLLQNDPDWGVRVASLRALTSMKPFRLQDALVERLHADSDPFVRKEILLSLQKLGPEYLPPIVYEFLLEKDLADSAYQFLVSVRDCFAKRIQEDSKSQPPSIRRILKTIVG